MSEGDSNLGAKVGGTAIAIIVSLAVIVIVSAVVATVAGVVYYYMGNMRIEAALVIGQIIGGIASIYAARSACDATIKTYSTQAIFVTVAALSAIGAVYELQQDWTLQTLTRLASVVSMTGAAWFVFWRDEV